MDYDRAGFACADGSLYVGRRVLDQGSVQFSVERRDADPLVTALVHGYPAHIDAPYELVSVSGVNHWAPTQAPDAVAKAILDRVGRDAGSR